MTASTMQRDSSLASDVVELEETRKVSVWATPVASTSIRLPYCRWMVPPTAGVPSRNFPDRAWRLSTDRGEGSGVVGLALPGAVEVVGLAGAGLTVSQADADSEVVPVTVQDAE